MTDFGFVGLGAMGSRVAARLIGAGHDVYGTNRTKAKADPLIHQGLIWRDTPRDVASSAEVVFSMVTDDAALAAIATKPHGLLAGLRPGAVLVDLSTVSPRASRRLAAQAAQVGAQFLDAPVSGSLPQATEGSLSMMVGGDRAAFERVEPVLRQLATSIRHVGPNGHGLVLKLAINISLAVQVVALSEGLVLAERAGLDRDLALEVMIGSQIASPMLHARAPLLRDLPAEPWFPMSLLRKDIGLALQVAREYGVHVPTAHEAANLLAIADRLGLSGRDIAGLLEVIEELSASAPEKKVS